MIVVTKKDAISSQSYTILLIKQNNMELLIIYKNDIW